MWGKYLVLFGVGVGLIAGILWIGNYAKQKSGEVSLQPGSGTANVSVPLPQETDIIRSFFQLIGEHRPTDALSMMTPDLVGDESSKQTWAVQFNSFASLTVVSVEPTLQETWSTSQHEYKVVLTANMKSEAVTAPIPYYGWTNGTNLRWITIVKSENVWKISQIATGP